MKNAQRLAALLVLGGAGLAAVPAPATAIMGADWVVADGKILGKLAIEPEKGDLISPVTLTSAGSCPLGTHSITRLYGPMLPDGGENVVGNQPIHLMGSPPENRLTTELSITLEQAGKVQEPPVELEGAYKMVMDCQVKTAFNEVTEVFNFYVGELNIHNGRYTSKTRLTELPKTPGPAIGPEAIAYAEEARKAPDLADLQTQQTAASEDTEDSGVMVPLAVTGAIVVLGVGAVVLSSRRSKSRVPAGRRR